MSIEAQRVGRVSLRAFRNIAQETVEPGAHFNVIHGENGAGKSNLLEAIYYLGSLQSFRGGKADDLIHLEQNAAAFSCDLHAKPLSRALEVRLSRSGPRRVTIDGKRPRATADWHRAVQMVLFHPGHIRIASAGPDLRRSFVDRILEQIDPVFGPSRATYDKALRSRNRLLKSERVDPRSIKAYDEILSKSGEVVGQSRAALIQDLSPRVTRAFDDVIGEDLGFTMTYAPRVEPTEAAIRHALEESFRKDCARGFTADGPHGDDITFLVGGSSAKQRASQGQQRAIVLALKVAELDILSARTQKVPILLLDDVSSELDRSRNRRFFELLAKLGGQVFLTTTHPEFILLEENRVDFKVQSGSVQKLKKE